MRMPEGIILYIKLKRATGAYPDGSDSIHQWSRSTCYSFTLLFIGRHGFSVLMVALSSISRVNVCDIPLRKRQNHS